ncbi:MAG TPA: DUF1269 domain-containing protein [Acidimicrobiales bacterium]|nr:DUF1269 domain-containing protein [Acidimicrobiales bacterium]
MSETRDDEATGATDDEQQTLVGISFADTFRAQEFLTAATRLAANQRLRLRDAVIVTKDANGKTVVRETVDLEPGRSAMSGALWAGLFGLLLGGPVGWVVGAGVGAGTGAVAAKVIDHGVSDEWVRWFRETVEADTVTLVLLVEDLDRAALVGELERFAGARLVYANLDPLWVGRMRTALGEPEAPKSVTASDDPAAPDTTDTDAATDAATDDIADGPPADEG